MNSKKVIFSLMWRFLERTGSQGVAFVVSVILARLLDPSAYGTIALVTVFTSIMQVFINSGLGAALIQKKNADTVDFSTVFYFNIVFCLVMYAIMFFAAPYIAKFYNMPELTAIVRVLSLTLIVSGVRNIQQSYVSKHLLFKTFFYSTIISTILSAIVGIFMAYKGFGVWALVAQTLVSTVTGTLILWVIVPFRPILAFSFKRLKGLFSYGWKLLCAGLIDVVYKDIRQLIIGKLYTTNDLAYYNKGNQFPSLVITNINTSIDSVLLPAMSQGQDDKELVKMMTRRAISISSYVMWPIMIGLAACADSFIPLLLTEKWIPCIPYLRIFCFTSAFYPIHTANLNAIKAMGRSDMFLNLEVIKKIVGVAVLIISVQYGPLTMAASTMLTTFFAQIVNSWPNKKLLGYSYLDQLKDIFPSILLSAVMGVIVYMLQFIGLNYILTIIVQVLTGAIIYIAGSAIFKMESFEYILGTVKNFRKMKS